MPTWRCPHCGTPQTETARCWVCRRSSTACGTCRHFRRSVAAQLGYCGLDRRRIPLVGDEIRACWEARTSLPVVASSATPDARPVALADRPGGRSFVEVTGTAPDAATVKARRTNDRRDRSAPQAAAAAEPDDGPRARPTEPGWSLWGDLDG